MPVPPTPPAVYVPPAPVPAPPPPRIVPPQRARANLNSYFSADDYPAAALRGNDQGTTGFSLTIGANGRVEACTVTSSSGSSALDQATCRILRSRARYTPARDQSGNPTSGRDSGRVTWRLPSE
jgi:protein TonB